MKKIRKGFILPSAALTVRTSRIYAREVLENKPRVGDVIYGEVIRLGQHQTVENKHGRIHTLTDNKRGLFVFGNRYAPDAFEAYVPSENQSQVDMVARSGLIGEMKTKNSNVSDCTRIRVLGYVVDRDGKQVSTYDKTMLPKVQEPSERKKSKLILVVGTAMNSGKSVAAAACCWSISTMGHTVYGSKVTGTASLKDILLMEDMGAESCPDFTYLGHPSTFMLDADELNRLFWSLEAAVGCRGKGYWVVELADGILQRETAMLLASEYVRSRIHKLIFCSHDALGAMGGLHLLKDKFNLIPDAISGLCSSAPLAICELRGYTDIPSFNAAEPQLEQMASILLG